MLSVLFRKLRLVYDKCIENCAGLEPVPPEVSMLVFESAYLHACMCVFINLFVCLFGCIDSVFWKHSIYSLVTAEVLQVFIS